MGNGLRKLCLCFTGEPGEISKRRNVVFSSLPDPPDEVFGHSFCYIPPVPAQKPEDTYTSAAHHTFRAISGASISANTSTPLSTETFSYTSPSKSSAFESSDLFSSIPLQPIPRNPVHSSPILRNSTRGSDPIEGGFLSGPIERSFISEPLDNQLQRYMPKSKKRSLFNKFKNVNPKSLWSSSRVTNSGTSIAMSSNILSSDTSLFDENDDESFVGKNLQWAQGKAGEDRVHLVISGKHRWVFVGIYDGFNGPDATHFLSTSLYTNVYQELRGILWRENDSSSFPVNHSEVLKALSEGLRKTERSYLEIADLMLVENPELSLMGSCVLVMVMKGPDVYLMNVGDSRAILAQKCDTNLQRKKMRKVYEESQSLCSITACQLTMDHSTSVKEETRRISNEHPDDPSAIINDRVKGSLKVTRAFGAGFLKHPKWNKAVLEMFRIDYVGNSPYITCSPYLFHYSLKPNDKFLILSSDGLYQYFSNREAVSEVETFMSMFPEGDPAQHLVEEVLFRAAEKGGLDFHELLDIPQGGDRRKYHDDVSIIIISFQGRIWRSSV